MPNIASALKTEISRLARKELRAGTDASKKAIVAYRHQIAELKRRLSTVERELAALRRQKGRSQPQEPADDRSNLRFRAAGFAKHRQRLGLSAREMGLLLNASGLSVYKWEKGEAKPRAKHLQAIAELRTMGKREARQRLERLLVV